MSSEHTHSFLQAAGVRLHLVEAGPPNGPLLILLHGFPEFWQAWQPQIGYFARAGYRVWAPDQRGYNLSDKPSSVADYNLDLLAADVLALIDAANESKAFLVGHDWGGTVAWWFANKFPQRLHALGILNAPHHRVMSRTLRQSPDQRRRSFYFLFFRLPWLPERVLSAGNFRALTATLRRSSNAGAFSAAELEAYRRAWAQPRAMTGMLNWYRALFSARPARGPGPEIHVPTQIIWGARDTALSLEMAQPSAAYCDEGRLLVLDDATHWLHHEEPTEVNETLHVFFREKGGP